MQVVSRWTGEGAALLEDASDDASCQLSQLAAAAHLEVAAVEHAYGAVSEAGSHLEAAEHHLDLSVTLTGALQDKTRNLAYVSLHNLGRKGLFSLWFGRQMGCAALGWWEVQIATLSTHRPFEASSNKHESFRTWWLQM